MILAESVDRIAEVGVPIIERFYERLLDKVPAARPFFAGVNIKSQSVMLTIALLAVKEYPDLTKPVQDYLHIVGTKHHAVGIPRELYPPFVKLLIACVAETQGEDWNENLSQQWSCALNHACHLMFEGYDKDFNDIEGEDNVHAST